MSELISRQKLIEGLMECSMVGIGKRNPKGSKEEMLYEDYIKLDTVLELIESQPPADPWIPCSERLPNQEEYLKDDGRFIVTDGNRRYQGMFDIYDGKFKHDRFDCILEEDKCVIAWMPLPEPYKGGGVDG